MSSKPRSNGRLSLALKVGLVTAWAAVLVASGRFGPFLHARGLVFLLLGCVALGFTSFTVAEIWAACRDGCAPDPHRASTGTSALFWEATARNAWLTGSLGSVVFFVLALTYPSGAIRVIATNMSLAFVPSILGLAVAALALVPSLKLKDAMEALAPGEGAVPAGTRSPVRRRAWEHSVGPVLVVALVAWTVSGLPAASASEVPAPWGFLLHWPALFVVVGGTTAVLLLAGRPLARRIRSVSFAVAGAIGTLMGLVQVLLGFAARDIAALSAAGSFVVTTCFVSLLGTMLAAVPVEDEAAKAGGTGGYPWPSRVAWLLFPMLTTLYLLGTLAMVLTPMTVDKG
jgi:hypothetical protein